jgi:AcrR family transcriptional regulator
MEIDRPVGKIPSMTVKTAERPSARNRLLAAADELFYSEGVHVVGVDRIVEQHMRRRQERIARILAANDTPRERILGVFAEVEDLLAGSQFRGCRFISAAAESRPGDASELVAAQYRAWLWSLFTDLAQAAGAGDAKQLGRRLLLLYDGAAVAARMDPDRDAAAAALRSAVVALVDTAIPPRV